MFVTNIMNSGEYQRLTQYIRNYYHKSQSSSSISNFIYFNCLFMSDEKLK